jgi:hypothetical protein
MYTLLIYPGGRQVEALLLWASKDRMRLVIPGRSETAELSQIDGRWLSESGAAVEVGALVAGSTTLAGDFRDEARLLVRRAS